MKKEKPGNSVSPESGNHDNTLCIKLEKKPSYLVLDILDLHEYFSHSFDDGEYLLVRIGSVLLQLGGPHVPRVQQPVRFEYLQGKPRTDTFIGRIVSLRSIHISDLLGENYYVNYSHK